jgi:hypothetical protein
LVQFVGRLDDNYGEVPVAFVGVVAGHDVSEVDLIEYSRG